MAFNQSTHLKKHQLIHTKEIAPTSLLDDKPAIFLEMDDQDNKIKIKEIDPLDDRINDVTSEITIKEEMAPLDDFTSINEI